MRAFSWRARRSGRRRATTASRPSTRCGPRLPRCWRVTQRGELKLPPPTLRNLEDLAAHATIDAALAWARARVVAAILPKLVPLGDTLAIVLPWDPEYATLPGEGIAIAADHPVARPPSRFVLSEGRWWGRPPGV